MIKFVSSRLFPQLPALEPRTWLCLRLSTSPEMQRNIIQERGQSYDEISNAEIRGLGLRIYELQQASWNLILGSLCRDRRIPNDRERRRCSRNEPARIKAETSEEQNFGCRSSFEAKSGWRSLALGPRGKESFAQSVRSSMIRSSVRELLLSARNP